MPKVRLASEKDVKAVYDNLSMTDKVEVLEKALDSVKEHRLMSPIDAIAYGLGYTKRSGKVDGEKIYSIHNE